MQTNQPLTTHQDPTSLRRGVGCVCVASASALVMSQWMSLGIVFGAKLRCWYSFSVPVKPPFPRSYHTRLCSLPLRCFASSPAPSSVSLRINHRRYGSMSLRPARPTAMAGHATRWLRRVCDVRYRYLRCKFLHAIAIACSSSNLWLDNCDPGRRLFSHSTRTRTTNN